MYKLLVPIDSSENSMRALDFALGVAREIGPIELCLVNAQEKSIVYGEVEVYLSTEKAEKMLHEHAQELLRPAIEKAKAAGVPFTSTILVGDIAPSIVRHAEDAGCSGIVMGTHGRTAIGSLFMGSVAMKVVHLSKLPVTLVK